jgi:mutator protein MutT
MAIPKLLVMSGLILNQDGKALMGFRKPGKPRPSLWEYPGGKVEPGEDPRFALVRELREELGIETHPRRYLGEVRLELEVDFLLQLWATDIVSGEPQALDHSLIRWVAPADAVVDYPCTPTTYMLHQAVIGELRRQAAGW